MTQEETDHCLGEEVGYRAIEHPAERADPVVELRISDLVYSDSKHRRTMPWMSRFPVRTKSPFRAEV